MPVVVAAAMLSATGVTTESNRESLQGVWQTVEVTTTGPAARTRTIPELRANLTIFTANHTGGHHDHNTQVAHDARGRG